DEVGLLGRVRAAEALPAGGRLVGVEDAVADERRGAAAAVRAEDPQVVERAVEHFVGRGIDGGRRPVAAAPGAPRALREHERAVVLRAPGNAPAGCGAA